MLVPMELMWEIMRAEDEIPYLIYVKMVQITSYDMNIPTLITCIHK